MGNKSGDHTSGTPDQALEKAAEERHIEKASGIRRDDRLVVREKSQHHAGTVQRRDVRDDLSDAQARAYDEIALGHREAIAGIGWKSPCLHEAGGGRPAEDVLADYSRRMKRYIQWYKALYDMPMVRAVCIDIAGQGMNYRECARKNHGLITHKTVKKYLLLGLDRYVEINRMDGGRPAAHERLTFIGEEKV